MVSVPEGTSTMFQGIKCRTIAGFLIQTEYSEIKLNIERSRWHWRKVPDKCASAEVHTMPDMLAVLINLYRASEVVRVTWFRAFSYGFIPLKLKRASREENRYGRSKSKKNESRIA